MSVAVRLLLAALAWEGGWYVRRRVERGRVYELARQRSNQTGKPLLVVGAPDGGVTSGYPCGDMTVDLQSSSGCPAYFQADITRRLPFEDDSCVVFVSCVLEYVDDYEAAIRELHRVAGNDLFVVRVEPWTATAYLYPGAKRTLPASVVR